MFTIYNIINFTKTRREIKNVDIFKYMEEYINIETIELIYKQF